MNKQQVKIIIMTMIIGAYIALIGTTYAYYQVRIIENTEEKSIDVTSKTLEVTYVDGTAEFSGSRDGYIFPGETFKKYFSVENTGDDVAKFNIILRNITNTFTRTEDWTYRLGKVTDTNNDGIIDTEDSIAYIIDDPVIFPTTSDKVAILENINIAYQTKETYVLVVSYANSEEDQSVDMNKELTATIDIATE